MQLVQASPEQRQKLLGIFAARLADINAGNRAFTYAAKELGLEDELIHLGEECMRQQIGFDTVLAAYRTFLVNQLGAERCADSPDPAPMVKRFNERLRLAGYLARSDLDPIPAAALRPASTDGKLKLEAYWRTPQSKRLLSAIKHLRFGAGATPLGPAQKATPEWQAEFRGFLNDLEDWTASDEASPHRLFSRARDSVCQSAGFTASRRRARQRRPELRDLSKPERCSVGQSDPVSAPSAGTHQVSCFTPRIGRVCWPPLRKRRIRCFRST